MNRQKYEVLVEQFDRIDFSADIAALIGSGTELRPAKLIDVRMIRDADDTQAKRDDDMSTETVKPEEALSKILHMLKLLPERDSLRVAKAALAMTFDDISVGTL